MAVREPDLCQTIEVGGRTYRYGISKKPGGTPRNLVVADNGVPGNSTLVADGVSRTIAAVGLSELPQDVAVVVLEEPWVTRREPTGSCAVASQKYLQALQGRSLPGDVIPAMKKACAQFDYGWNSESYRDVLAAVAVRHGAPIRGFAGSSWAAVRLAWLSSDSRFKISRAVLSSPLFPELSADKVLRHQADSIARLLPLMMRSDVSLPSGQLLAAAASQLPGLDPGALPRTVRLSETQLSSLAATYLGLYGNGQLSPGRLAYYQELCAAGFAPSAGTSWDGQKDDPYGFLVTLHEGCPSRPAQRPQILSTGIDVCISLARNDQIVPFAEAEALLRNSNNYYLVEGPHGAGVASECRNFMGGGTT